MNWSWGIIHNLVRRGVLWRLSSGKLTIRFREIFSEWYYWAFGFPSMLIQRIMECVIIVKFSICIIGELERFFQVQRGCIKVTRYHLIYLWSSWRCYPDFWDVCHNLLHSGFTRNVIGWNYHTCALLMTYWYSRLGRRLWWDGLRILSLFRVQSSLQSNILKSEVFFGATSEEEEQAILEDTRFTRGNRVEWGCNAKTHLAYAVWFWWCSLGSLGSGLFIMWAVFLAR